MNWQILLHCNAHEAIESGSPDYGDFCIVR
jgi:hypothetical protein